MLWWHEQAMPHLQPLQIDQIQVGMAQLHRRPVTQHDGVSPIRLNILFDDTLAAVELGPLRQPDEPHAPADEVFRGAASVLSSPVIDMSTRTTPVPLSCARANSFFASVAGAKPGDATGTESLRRASRPAAHECGGSAPGGSDTGELSVAQNTHITPTMSPTSRTCCESVIARIVRWALEHSWCSR